MLAMAKRKPALGFVRSVPAPVGGLNAKDSIAAMPPTDAIVMENWFPQPSYVSIRNGSAAWSTGLPGWVESLLVYSGATADKMFAASVTGFYTVTTAGAVGAAVQSGLTNARWEHINVATAGGQFMYALNGVDKPRLYDGTNWVAVDAVSVPAITGVTTTLLRSPALWKSRVWFVENNSMRAWYLPTSSVGGAAASIDFGAEFKLGGSLQSIVTTSITSASSLDDYILFVSTKGEVIGYRGADPAVAGLFGIALRVNMGRPIGRRCHFHYASDVIFITQDGFTPFSSLLMDNRDNLSRQLSYKIVNSVSADATAYAANFGWEGILYPPGGKLLINVPQTENTKQYQYVMNTITQSWSIFTGWNAACFAMMVDSLFFGGNTVVDQADSGTSDKGAFINSNLVPAYNYMGYRGTKLWTMMRPIFQTSGALAASISPNVDFATPVAGSSAVSSTGSGSDWNTATWNVSAWATSDVLQSQWLSFPATGFAATPTITMSTKTITAKLHSIDYLFQKGGVL